MKNVTIAIDENMLTAGRHYAREHHTSLNKLIRQLLERTVVRSQSANWTDEFFRLADRSDGDSRGKRWKREGTNGRLSISQPCSVATLAMATIESKVMPCGLKSILLIGWS